MMMHYFIALTAFFGIFILFLVLSKTLNNIINHFVKLQYLIQKEYDLKKERIAIAELLKEENDASQKYKAEAEKERDEQIEKAAPSPPPRKK